MKKDWEKSEEKACQLWGGRRTPASGSRPTSKLDVIIHSGKMEGWRIENKFQSEKESFSVKKGLLSKIRKQAAVTGDKAFLRIDLGGEVYVVFRELDALEVID